MNSQKIIVNCGFDNTQKKYFITCEDCNITWYVDTEQQIKEGRAQHLVEVHNIEGGNLNIFSDSN